MTQPLHAAWDPRSAVERPHQSVAQLESVVAVCEPGTLGESLIQGLGGRNWPAQRFTDIDAARRHVATKSASMVVVAGVTMPWLARAVHACRQAGRFPIAVVGTSGANGSRLLLDEGATTVIDASTAVGDVSTRLLALARSMPTGRDIDVRWLESGDLRLDLSARRCTRDGLTVRLSLSEFELLRYLMSHAEQVVSRGRIISDLWNLPEQAGINTLRLNVRRLRLKLGDDPHQPRWIEAVRGVGYQFMRPVAYVGQDRSDERLRTTVAVLNAQHDAMYDLIGSLQTVGTARAIADTAVAWALERGFADASTVFRFSDRANGRYSELEASAGMSNRWRQAISRGHPVDDNFIASAAYLRGDVIQLSDMSRPSGRFPVTVSMSSAENLHACVIFPLFRRGRIWGDIGFLSKETRAFPPARARYLRSVAELVSMALATVDGEVDDDNV